ncbi:MAG: hypothetical protein CVT49_03760 [candidate division Zixibacteria bacterium HGW-Zixibacteria-1]|nr:MAG: hypothetical protein CVT49_03760 [candidate division Zixibacteria bacterium HGW-Zixibacteria-1]
MDCRFFRESLTLKLGDPAIDTEEKVHLESCVDCRKWYESLQALETSLNKMTPKPLAAAEFAVVQERLDAKINGYLNRATGFYRLMVRYGVAVSAVFMLVFISIFSNTPGVENNSVVPEFYYSSYTGEIELFDDSWIDDQYVAEAVGDFVGRNGFGSSELVIDELSAEELKYLENNIELGGLL